MRKGRGMMNRPDVESIETRLKELIAGPTYVEALTLIGWIKQLESNMDSMQKIYESHMKGAVKQYNKDNTEIAELQVKIDGFEGIGNLVGEMKKELNELRNIGEEFIERRNKGEIRSTYTYNRFRRALGKDDSGAID